MRKSAFRQAGNEISIVLKSCGLLSPDCHLDAVIDTNMSACFRGSGHEHSPTSSATQPPGKLAHIQTTPDSRNPRPCVTPPPTPTSSVGVCGRAIDADGLGVQRPHDLGSATPTEIYAYLATKLVHPVACVAHGGSAIYRV